jgi:DNA replication and repair protein RecF
MYLEQLRVDKVRVLSEIDLELGAGINFFGGANGAGKTSVLEAIYLLSGGRSFRSANADSLVCNGKSELSVFGRLRCLSGRVRHIGLLRSGGRWTAQLDGERLAGVGELLRVCAVVCFEPGSDSLVGGGSELRRRFLDWGVFHVEQRFVQVWRELQKALRQRNAHLRGGGDDSGLLAWDEEFASRCILMAEMRERYVDLFRPTVVRVLGQWLPELGPASLSVKRGWDENKSVRDVLKDRRLRDRALGYTTAGAHRADFALSFEGLVQHDQLSRGQEKLCALACVLAQAEVYAMRSGEWPIVCVDELASELDAEHQVRLLRSLVGCAAQVIVTGTEVPNSIASCKEDIRMFHVEQGLARQML